MSEKFSPEYQCLIRTLISARKSQGLSQTAFATKLGKLQTFVSKFENKERRLDMVEYVKLCRALGVNPAQALRDAGLITEDE